MIEKKVGFAGDLFIPSTKYMNLTGGASLVELKVLITLCDLFLMHDILYIRADAWTLRELYNCFTQNEIDELLNNDRLKFYPPIYHREKISELPEILAQHFNDLRGSMFLEPLDTNRLLKQVFDNMLVKKHNTDFEEFNTGMKELFYKRGIQRESFFSMDVIIGFDQAIEKIRELWACDMKAINFDREVLYYLGICESAAKLQEKSLPFKNVSEDEESIIEKLHSFKNIPSLAMILAKDHKPTKKFLEVINSHEAADLRTWLQKSRGEDIDVRDLYSRTISKLPAKNTWVDWLRFGGVSVFSTILTTIVTQDPIAGFAIGSALGTGDKMFGDKLLNKTSTQYNPDAWFSYIGEK